MVHPEGDIVDSVLDLSRSQAESVWTLVTVQCSDGSHGTRHCIRLQMPLKETTENKNHLRMDQVRREQDIDINGGLGPWALFRPEFRNDDNKHFRLKCDVHDRYLIYERHFTGRWFVTSATSEEIQSMEQGENRKDIVSWFRMIELDDQDSKISKTSGLKVLCGNWYAFWSGFVSVMRGQKVELDVDEDMIPPAVREGVAALNTLNTHFTQREAEEVPVKSGEITRALMEEKRDCDGTDRARGSTMSLDELSNAHQPMDNQPNPVLPEGVFDDHYADDETLREVLLISKMTAEAESAAVSDQAIPEKVELMKETISTVDDLKGIGIQHRFLRKFMARSPGPEDKVDANTDRIQAVIGEAAIWKIVPCNLAGTEFKPSYRYQGGTTYCKFRNMDPAVFGRPAEAPQDPRKTWDYLRFDNQRDAVDVKGIGGAWNVFKVEFHPRLNRFTLLNMAFQKFLAITDHGEVLQSDTMSDHTFIQLIGQEVQQRFSHLIDDDIQMDDGGWTS